MNNLSERQNIGAEGEQIASDYLESKGFKIIERNYRCKRGELDIIAMENDILVFVEIKTRKPDYLKQPFVSVTRSKEKKVLSIADYYIYKNKIRNTRTRFDVISIVLDTPKPEIKHFRGAFGTWQDEYSR